MSICEPFRHVPAGSTPYPNKRIHAHPSKNASASLENRKLLVPHPLAGRWVDALGAGELCNAHVWEVSRRANKFQVWGAWESELGFEADGLSGRFGALREVMEEREISDLLELMTNAGVHDDE